MPGLDSWELSSNSVREFSGGLSGQGMVVQPILLLLFLLCKSFERINNVRKDAEVFCGSQTS